MPTGDAAYPAVLAATETLEVFRALDGRFHRVELPFPARDVLAAAVFGGRLYLGTSGFGLTYAPLADLMPAGAAAAAGTVAGGSR